MGLAHTHTVPSPQEHPHASPQSSPPHCAGTGKVRKAQCWLKHPKNERSALEEQHPLLAVSARALELNKGDWELAQAHVLVCTRVFSVLPGLSLFQGIAEAMAGPMAVEPSFSAIPVSLPGGDTPDPLQARLVNTYRARGCKALTHVTKPGPEEFKHSLDLLPTLQARSV